MSDNELINETAELAEDVQHEMLDYCADVVADGDDPDGTHARILSRYAENGSDRAQQACNNLSVEIAAAKQTPSANSSGVGAPASSGSFADYQLSANADDARLVRIVDDPEKGEPVHMFNASDPGAVREASAAGAEEVRIVDLEDDPERAVDADPIFIADRQSPTGSFASYNARPETSMIPVNPGKLPE